MKIKGMNFNKGEHGSGVKLDTKNYPISELARRMWKILSPLKWRLGVGCLLIAIAGGIYGI
nr:hypothetical protein [Victivallales bacterium]